MIDADNISDAINNWYIYCKERNPKPFYCELTDFPKRPQNLVSLVTTTTSAPGTNINGTTTTTTI